MKQLLFATLVFLFLVACTENKKEWQHVEIVDLGQITPIGFSFQGDKMWIADGDHNQLVEINSKGEIQNILSDFERPMHIDVEKEVLFVPEYGSDQIIKLNNGEKSILVIPDSLDAPAGVDVYENEIAIADFYNHRIVYYDGQDWTSFGKEGKALGELYYPTDVQILLNNIVVADAYNNRIQIFDKKGNALKIIGESERLNAATGVFANEKEIFITDFENDRVLAYNHQGKIQQIISEKIDKPTDILIKDDILYIANYKGRNILKMKK